MVPGYRRPAFGGLSGAIILMGIFLPIAFGGFNLPIFFIALAASIFVGSLASGSPRSVYGSLYGALWMLILALFFITGSWIWFVIGGVLCGMSMSMFNMINLITIDDPLETAFKYPRTTLPPYMTPIEPQVGKFYDSPVALGAGAGAVLTVTMTALGTKLTTWTYRWMAAWSKWD